MKQDIDHGIEFDAVPYTYPMIPLRNVFLFPHMVIHFDVGRSKSLAAVEEAMMTDSFIVLATQKEFQTDFPKEEDIYSMGILAKIKQSLKLPTGSTRVLVEGIGRVSIDEIDTSKNYYEAKGIHYLKDENPPESKKLEAALRLIHGDMAKYLELSPVAGQEILVGLTDIEDPGRLCDVIASFIGLKGEDHFEILKELDVSKRLEKTHGFLRKEIELLKLEEKIAKRVQVQMDQVQKEYYLKEQISAIRKELGEDESIDEFINEYEEKLKKLRIPKDTREKIEKEINRLKHLNSQSPEFQVIRSYLEFVFDLPWNNYSRTNINLKKAEEILEEDHYGLKDVKEHILEYIAVRKLTNKMKSPILCLVGPPGVGKTSIASSIARAMGRKFTRMSLGGVRDEAEIRGHRKTYIGAMPGRVLQNLSHVKVNNPVFLFDEIDKMAQDFRGDPASALLEVLDPEQNNTFADHYIEVPFDLSKVLFVTTANYPDHIPEPLRDRMEIIRLSGYTPEEKFHIAKRHLLPKQLENHGLDKAEVNLEDGALEEIIQYYTREAGVRSLERAIARVLRKFAKEYADNKDLSLDIDKDRIEEFLGKRKFTDESVLNIPAQGLVKGLAWTAVGGEILNIEASTMPGKGKLQLTGSLGDVMKESAQTAVSYIRSNYEEFGIDKDFYDKLDLHIHVPEGATPKDGPSAGVSIATAILSALNGKKIRADVAMTGEITLQGRVLTIGGVKEKLIAASRYNVKDVFLPIENEKDLDDVPESAKEKLNFHFVEDIKEIFEKVFVDGED